MVISGEVHADPAVRRVLRRHGYRLHASFDDLTSFQEVPLLLLTRRQI